MPPHRLWRPCGAEPGDDPAAVLGSLYHEPGAQHQLAVRLGPRADDCGGRVPLPDRHHQLAHHDRPARQVREGEGERERPEVPKRGQHWIDLLATVSHC